MAFVHPFDDPDVVAGQGTLGLELLDDLAGARDRRRAVGGGGLASGVAIAVKSRAPGCRGDRRAGRDRRGLPRLAEGRAPVAVSAGLTIADGIAVKRPGELTLG